MKHTMLIAVDAKGKRRELLGPEVSDKEQRTAFIKFKQGALPKDAVRVEVWQRTRQTTGLDFAAQQARLKSEPEPEETE